MEDFNDLMNKGGNNQFAMIWNYYKHVDNVHNYFGETASNVKQEENSAPIGHPPVFSQELLTQAIENCQAYFWGNSAYVVVYCICRDDYKVKFSYSEFEKIIGSLHYKKGVRQCPPGTIASAFYYNPIFNEPIDNWDKFDPMLRVLKLRDELRKELKI